MPTFTETLDEIADGDLVARCTELLQELGAAVMHPETDGKGQIVLTLKLERQKGAVVVRGKAKITRPERQVNDAMFFVDAKGALVRDDPKQMRVPGTERGPRAVRFPTADRKDD